MPPTGLPSFTRTFVIGGGDGGLFAVVVCVVCEPLMLVSSELSLGFRMMNRTTATTATDATRAIRPALLMWIPPSGWNSVCVRPTQPEVHARRGEATTAGAQRVQVRSPRPCDGSARRGVATGAGAPREAY